MATNTELFKHIMDIKESQARTETTVTSIDRAINGHDRNPGLIHKVARLEGDRKYIYGFGAAITFILGIFEAAVHLFKGRP